jgi:hypothetical protein
MRTGASGSLIGSESAGSANCQVSCLENEQDSKALHLQTPIAHCAYSCNVRRQGFLAMSVCPGFPTES